MTPLSHTKSLIINFISYTILVYIHNSNSCIFIGLYTLIKEEKGEVWLYKYMCFIISSHVIFFILGTWIIENFFLLKENQIGYVILFFLFLLVLIACIQVTFLVYLYAKKERSLFYKGFLVLLINILALFLYITYNH